LKANTYLNKSRHCNLPRTTGMQSRRIHLRQLGKWNLQTNKYNSKEIVLCG